MTNWEISRALHDLKILLELTNEKSSASLYEQAAYTLAAINYPIHQSSGNLYFIPSKIREDVYELDETGNCSTKELLERAVPKSLRTIARIPGLRPENASKLYNMVPADSIADVKRALGSGRISNLFGARFEESLRRGIFEYEKESSSLNLFEAYSYAKSITMNLQELYKIDVAGSVRRGKEVTGNIDFVVQSKYEPFYESILNVVPVKSYERKGENICQLKDKYGNLLRFYLVSGEYYYSALQYFTGSKAHNKEIVQIVKAKGFKIGREGYALINAQSEEEFYEKLDMQYIPPEIREGEEEIELAKSFSIPKLIEISDIQGDLHVHSDFSDGTNTISELKEEASFHKYSYFAITDHSQSLKIAKGLTRERLFREIKIIDKINSEKMEPYILKGTESEINEDGSIDTTYEERSKLDLVIGALHSFSQKSFDNTKRVIKAMRTGLINTIAHPTGRILNVRESMNIDFIKIAEEAAATGTALEINLFPNRMDLSTGLIKQAYRTGVRTFTIGTDAHNAGHFNFMEYGLKVLRRAWLMPDSVLNAYQLEELKEILWMKKH
jgi:DNA polymerase (family 10)